MAQLATARLARLNLPQLAFNDIEHQLPLDRHHFFAAAVMWVLVIVARLIRPEYPAALFELAVDPLTPWGAQRVILSATSNKAVIL